MIDVSVVIVNRNTEELLNKSLESVFNAEADKITKEVFVVDNGSTDKSVEMVRTKFPAVRLIINSDNLGFAKANNQAIKECTGRYILLLNSDAYLLNNALTLMVEFMNTHIDAGIVGPKLLNPDGSIQFSCYNIPAVYRALIEMSLLNRILPLDIGDMLCHFKYDTVREVGYVSGACMMIRREVIEKTGLLDERFFMYAEEADWCMRAKKSGFKVYFTPEPVATHAMRGSLKKYELLDISREKLKSNYLLFEKHYGRLKARLFCLFVFLYLALRFIMSIGNRKKRKLYSGLINEDIMHML